MSRSPMEVFAQSLDFPEAPTWHDDSLWVADVIAGGVIRLDVNGAAAARMLDGRRGIGGLVSTADGRLLATGRDLTDAATGAVVVERPAEVTGFNDIGVDGAGAVLMGVLTYRPLAGEVATPGAVARLGRSTIDWAWFTPISWPNGIASLRSGEVVIADYSTGVLWLIDPDGRRQQVICESSSGHYDGLCVDEDDHIWLATGPGSTLERRTRTGRLLETIQLPAAFVSSVCFSGADPRTLFATAAGCDPAGGAGAVIAITVDTAGSPPPTADLGGVQPGEARHSVRPDQGAP